MGFAAAVQVPDLGSSRRIGIGSSSLYGVRVLACSSMHVDKEPSIHVMPCRFAGASRQLTGREQVSMGGKVSVVRRRSVRRYS